MQIFIMFLWCFILSAIPFKKIIFGTLYVAILAIGIHFTYNYTTELVKDDILLIKHSDE